MHCINLIQMAGTSYPIGSFLYLHVGNLWQDTHLGSPIVWYQLSKSHTQQLVTSSMVSNSVTMFGDIFNLLVDGYIWQKRIKKLHIPKRVTIAEWRVCIYVEWLRTQEYRWSCDEEIDPPADTKSNFVVRTLKHGIRWRRKATSGGGECLGML